MTQPSDSLLSPSANSQSKPSQTSLSQTTPSLSKVDSSKLAGVLILAGGLSTRMGSPKALLTLPTGDTLLDYQVRQASQLGVPIMIADNGQGFNVNTNIRLQLQAQNISLVHVADYHAVNVSANADANNNAKPKSAIGPLGAILAGMLQCLDKYSFRSESFSDTDTNTKKETKADIKHKSQSQPIIDDALPWLMVISCDSLVSAPNIWQIINANPQTLKSDSNAEIFCLEGKDLTGETRLYPLLGLYQLRLATELQAYLEAGERRVMRFTNPKCRPIAMPKTWYNLANLNTPADFQRACQQLQTLGFDPTE